MTTTHVLDIGRRRFVVGLFWQSLSKPRELRREAAELADKISFDLMLLRREQSVAQAGYAHSDDGVQPGMVSLAAAVAHGIASRGVLIDGRKQAPHSWLAVFELPDGRWAYFAVRDDGFLPNGDVCGTKEELLERLLGDYSVGGWQAVFGHASLGEHGLHNFEPCTLQDLVVDRRGHARIERAWVLRPTRRRIPWKRVALAALVLALVGGAGLAWWSHVRDLERERALEQARRQLAAKQGNDGAPPHPWPEEPHPAAFVRVCLDNFELAFAGGWQLDEYACAAGQATHAWSRGNSTVGHLLSKVPDAVVDLSGDKATYRVDLKFPRSLDERLMPAKDVLMPLLARFQGMGLTVTLSTVALPPPSTRPDGTPVPRPDWQTFGFVAKAGGVPPAEIVSLLDRPGLRLQKLFRRNGGEWTFEGVIYAK